MNRLLQYVVLPAAITQFERNYLARMNSVATLFFLSHVPFLAVVAWANDTGWMHAAALALLGTVGPVVARKLLNNPRHVSVVFGFTAMYMGALLVHFGRGIWTIEMHFYFFVALALLAVFANPLVIITAAVTVALHHLAFWFFIPVSVFNYEAPLSSVLVHAAFVVVESVAACFVARSFFDNVIGLEHIVAARTAQLDARNRDMRLVFDNVQQGLVSVDAQGRVSQEMSRAIATWFGSPPADASLWDWMSHINPTFAESLRLACDMVFEDILPQECSLEAMPKHLEFQGRSYEWTYQLVRSEQKISSLLILVSDVTERVAREAADDGQREVLAVFQRINRDRGAFLEFYTEANEVVKTIATEPCAVSDVELKRLVHTLKGNSGMYGMHTIARACERVEQRCQETREPLDAAMRATITSAWKHSAERLHGFVNEAPREAVEIDDDEYNDIKRKISTGAPRAEVLRVIESWKNEPTRIRLERLGEQAQQLGKRLCVGDIEVEVKDNGLRVPREQYAKIWSTMVHAVRNAVDHGFASGEPDSRVHPKLVLETRCVNDMVSISISDNGKGIDWERVREKARARGIAHNTRRELEEAVLKDGLSTRDDVSETSGRGVGLSALAQAARDMSGDLFIADNPKGGATIEVRVPRPNLDAETLAAAAALRMPQAHRSEQKTGS